jgi:hypothetical protein
LPRREFADTLERPARSRLILLEDGVPLGPLYADHAQIRAYDRGQYSHWGEYLYFASSDDSRPDCNGPRDAVLIPRPAGLADLPSAPSCQRG